MAGLRLSIDPTGVERGGSVVERELDTIKQKAGQTEAAIVGGSERSGSALGRLGSVAQTAARGLAAIAAAYFSVQAAGATVTMARDFNAALAETSTLIEGTPQQMSQLSEAARDLARSYGTDATPQVQAFYQAISGGASSVAAATELLDAANRLAIGGATDVTTAVGVLTTATNVYSAAGLTAAEASDALFVAVRAGVTTIPELSAAIGAVIPLSEALGVSFSDTLAAVAALTKGGLTTATAVTGLRAAMTAVLGPSQQALELAQALGLEFSAAAIEAEGFAGFMANVVEATGGSSEQMQQLFGSVEAVGAALAFSGSAGQFMTDILEQMEQSAGATDEAYQKMADSLDQRWSRATASARDIALTLGNAMLSVLVPALEAAAAAMTLVADNTDALAFALGLLALRAIPSAVGGMITLAGWLATAEGLFIAGAVAARGMALAMNTIPFVAVVSGMTAIYRLIQTELEANRALIESRNQLNEALNVYATTRAPSARDAALELARAEETAARATLITLEATMAQLQASMTDDMPDYARQRRQDAIDRLAGPLAAAQERTDALRRTIYALMTEIASGAPAVDGAAAGADNLAASMANVTAATYEAIPTTAALRSEYGSLAEVVRGLMQANNDLAVADANRGYVQAVDSAAALSSELQAAGRWTGALSRALLDARAAGGFEEQAAAALALAQEVARAAGGAEHLSGRAREVYEALVTSARAAVDLATASGSIDLSGAVTQAAELARQYGISLELARTLAGMGATENAASLGSDERGSQRGAMASGREFVSARARAAADRRAAAYQASLLPGGRGGGGGGGASEADQAAEAYDRLMASLDPLVRATQDWEEAQSTINLALRSGRITAEEAATAYSLARQEFERSSASVRDASSVWETFQSAGASAIDRLIQGSGNLRDALIEVVQQLLLAIANQQLLQAGGQQVSSVGGLIMSLFSGFFDDGGVIPNGSMGVVGERGPEVVRSTSHGTVVTSRADTARMGGQQAAPMVLTGQIGVSVDDDGKIQAYVRRMGVQAAQQGAQAAVGAVKQGLPGWQSEYQLHGVIA